MIIEKLNSILTSKTFLAKAPGRINLIGEHTDYNQGFVLPASINKYIFTALKPRKDQKIILHALDIRDVLELNIKDIHKSKKRWANYILGVVNEFILRGHKISGFDLHFTGDLPIGSGLSSSAALECSVATILSNWLGIQIDKLSLAQMCQQAEHKYVGVMCGIMDQFISMFGKKNHVIKLDCRSLEYEYIPFEKKGIKIILFDTNIKHSLANSEYNLRHQQCLEAIIRLNRHYPHILSLRDVSREMLEKVLKKENPLLYNRSLYVVEENQRLLSACEDLKKNDMKAFGEKMFSTHQGLSKLYEVSCPEQDFLVDQAKTFKDVLGARMMGGGFGGCTINIINEDAANTICSLIKKKYSEVIKKDLFVYDVNIENGSSLIINPRKEKTS